MPDRRKVIVLGSSGQLGAVAAARFARAHDVVALTRRELDVTDHGALLAAVTAHGPAVLVNCTAYTDVDGAEDAASTALAVNAFAVQSMAEAARRVGSTLVHYSTDFVFDGSASTPYREEDRPSPRSVYAASKLLGEWFAGDAPRWYVLRVESLFGGPAARSSVDKIVAAIREGREATVFVDRVVSPSYVDDVVEATAALLATEAPVGLYHCVNTGCATWLEVGREIVRLLGGRGSLRPVGVDEVRLRAARPRYCALANDKLRRLGIEMPSWQDALARHVGRLDSGPTAL